MNYAKSWRPLQREKFETAVIRAMYWAMTGLLFGAVIAVAVIR